MPRSQDIEKAVARVTGQASLLQELLAGALEWPIDPAHQSIDELGYGWTPEELNAHGIEKRLVRGQVCQLQLRTNQPWGIFVLEFALERVSRTILRKVLRGLVPNRRRNPELKSWQHDNLLFICTTKSYQSFTFAHFRGDKAHSARLATFGWTQGDKHLRTLCEHNLPALAWPDNANDNAWLDAWAAAFDVEAVTKRFFVEYREVFEKVEKAIKGVPAAARRDYTQRLFNRLLFLYFIQRKHWLKFEGSEDYLRGLYEKAEAGKEDFLNKRLYWTFFHGLNLINEAREYHSDDQLQERRGEVPFLNGGLFDLEDEYDVQDKVTIPNRAFGGILDLFEKYNFTVSESTPLDVEVAVDPEMLGKVFEELVTGRHESGSYYTPRPIVAFMCREALKHYLARVVPDAFAVAKFVDDGDPGGLTAPEAVLQALKDVKVCDPACGSGAYLLGMMQELLRLRQALFAKHRLDHSDIYHRKLEIIQNNLYGVDIDKFAVNIAKLRLWLSLVVDFEPKPGERPPPLPNLDFKIECGDSLTAGDPQKVDNLFRHAMDDSAKNLVRLKSEYIRAYDEKKKTLIAEIKEIETKLRHDLHDNSPDGAIEWRVAFAEVFQAGGFDIALENPPYVRMELFKESKPRLKAVYPHVYDGSADLYVYFFARTHQVLKPGGVACVITTNKWLKAGYAEGLRRFFAKDAWVASVVDFGHAKQIFQSADVFPSIVVLRKPTGEAAPVNARVCAIAREKLRLEEVGEQVGEEAYEYPRERLGSEAWVLEQAGVIELIEKIRSKGISLREFAKTVPYRGILTGLNEAFLLDDAKKSELVKADPKSRLLFKPYVRGQDISRWFSQSPGLWMLALKSSGNHSWPWSGKGKNAEKVFRITYPSIHAHLNQYRDALIERQDQGEHWWELRACAYWEKFEQPKIVYQEIQFHSCYAFDRKGMLANNKVFFIPVDDPYILALLNSPLVWWYNWRYLPHMKDEALSPVAFLMESLPVAKPSDSLRERIIKEGDRLVSLSNQSQGATAAVLGKLHGSFSLPKLPQRLQNPAALDEDALVVEVQKAVGKRQPLSVAAVKALRDLHAANVLPLQALAAEARQLERRVSDLVNEAYGLTPDEVKLMWDTAPPRMPGERPPEVKA